MAKWQSFFTYNTENELCNTAKNKTAKHTECTKNEKNIDTCIQAGYIEITICVKIQKQQGYIHVCK